MKKLYKLHAAAPDLIARAGAQRKRRDPTADDTLKAFAKDAGIAAGTLHALINPSQQQLRTRGGMHRQTAWKIAGALARWSGMDDDAAYQAIIVEETLDDQEPRVEVSV
jgi:hypothetical protein